MSIENEAALPSPALHDGTTELLGRMILSLDKRQEAIDQDRNFYLLAPFRYFRQKREYERNETQLDDLKLRQAASLELDDKLGLIKKKEILQEAAPLTLVPFNAAVQMSNHAKNTSLVIQESQLHVALDNVIVISEPQPSVTPTELSA